MHNKRLLNLDHHQQTTDYTCGPATLLSFLKYHDLKLAKKVTERKLSQILKTSPIYGTLTKNLFHCLQKTGKNFDLIRNANIIDLQNHIDNEHPSIVLWHDGSEWHWSTVVGYDHEDIILLDPYLKDGINQVKKEEFYTQWTKLAIK